MRGLPADTRATCEEDDPEVGRWTHDDQQEASGYEWALFDYGSWLTPFVYMGGGSPCTRAAAGWKLIQTQAKTGVPVACKAFRLITRNVLITGRKPVWLKEGPE